MNAICGDNRFEIIAKAKADLLDATNIDTSEDEMKVLDNFLFRCWRMGWLDRYDRKTENSSEKPNNCELQTIRCPKCGRTDYIRDMEKDMGIKGSHYKYKCINCNNYIKTEPTISKMEQVDEPKTQMKTQNSNLTFEKADEPQREEHCETCKHKDECEGATYEYKNTEWWCLAYVPIDEPQTELVGVKYHCINCAENGSYKCSKCDGEMYYKYDKDEPQTELVNDSPILVKDLVDDEFNPYDEECMRCKHLKLKCEFVPSYCKYEPKDEPTRSKMEQVDKDINVRSKDKPSNSEKPNNCEYAENPSGDAWECGCFLDTYCEHQIYDRNPDGTINIVECGYEPKDEPQTERSE